MIFANLSDFPVKYDFNFYAEMIPWVWAIGFAYEYPKATVFIVLRTFGLLPTVFFELNLIDFN